MKNKYIPFLKLKVNEIAALKALSPELKLEFSPFFDIPKRKLITSEGLENLISKAAKSVTDNLSGFSEIYLDDYDIDDSILINGQPSYGHAIKEFAGINFVPVVGLDRKSSRNNLVYKFKAAGLIKSNRFAIRLQTEDFESFNVARDDIESLLKDGLANFSEWDLILDSRYCHNVDCLQRAGRITKFIGDISKTASPKKIIITGSSIPSSIGQIIATEDDLIHPRSEIVIYENVKKMIKDDRLALGDYTVVSPLYSDLDIPAAALRNVITAKILYTFEDSHYISRGGSLRSHARGDLQYNDIAGEIVGAYFYRGAPYSFGDNFLDEKSRFIGKSVTASSILKPTINLHITYMLNRLST